MPKPAWILGLAVLIAGAGEAGTPNPSDGLSDRAVPVMHHEIRVSLDVPAHRLEALDTVRLATAPAAGEPWRFLLHTGLSVESVRIGGEGRDLEVETESGWDPRHFWRRPPYADLEGFEIAREVVVSPPPKGWGEAPVSLEIEYAGVIADSLHAPERAYERSFETTSGRIVERGAFLSGGSFWIPWGGEGLFSFDLEVEGPSGWRTVSQGDLVSEETSGDRRSMRWSCRDPMEEIYLIAGPYEFREIEHGGVKVQTFCYENTGPEITDRYLEATGPILDRYASLIGPYPFGKFALVENYWQTGYGMPSFTFLGDRVIRLPFILHTSYPHEILHNWWGNCVYVDSEKGNWCEGLTTYCADYMAKEEEGASAARDYRRNALLGYRDFAAGGGRDFALAQFRERDSARTQAVGYGKTLMVFHMLRRRLGDRDFFASLRRFTDGNRFRHAAWDDVRAAFEAETGEDLRPWFDQWIRRPGAVRLTLASVASGSEGPIEWVTRGVLVQEEPVFDARVPLTVSGAGEVVHLEVACDRARSPFEVRTCFRPEVVAADPGFDLFRLLHTEEVAPTLSGVLGAESTRIVVGADAQGALRDALVTLAESWAEDSTIVAVEEVAGTGLDDFDGGTWFFGDGPAAAELRVLLPESEAAVGDVGPGTASLVAAGRIGGRVDRPAGLFLPQSAEVVPSLGRKIPHYSKYSFLRFEGERNVAKGLWPAGESPLAVRVEAEVSGAHGSDPSIESPRRGEDDPEEGRT
jgi:hypothetical protein